MNHLQASSPKRPLARFINERKAPSNPFRGQSMNPTLMHLWSPKFAPNPAVFIPDGPEVTYGELQEQIEVVTEALRDGGVQAGDPIAIVLPNNLEITEAVPRTATGKMQRRHVAAH